MEASLPIGVRRSPAATRSSAGSSADPSMPSSMPDAPAARPRRPGSPRPPHPRGSSSSGPRTSRARRTQPRGPSPGSASGPGRRPGRVSREPPRPAATAGRARRAGPRTSVAGEEHVHRGGGRIEEIPARVGDMDVVGPRIEGDRRLRERIDVDGGDVRGPGLRGDDRDEPAPGRRSRAPSAPPPRPGAPRSSARGRSRRPTRTPRTGSAPHRPRGLLDRVHTGSTASARCRRMPGTPSTSRRRVWRWTNARRCDSGSRRGDGSSDGTRYTPAS